VLYRHIWLYMDMAERLGTQGCKERRWNGAWGKAEQGRKRCSRHRKVSVVRSESSITRTHEVLTEEKDLAKKIADLESKLR
jgi:hypothetical protein